jgi:hypothetical protein
MKSPPYKDDSRNKFTSLDAESKMSRKEPGKHPGVKKVSGFDELISMAQADFDRSQFEKADSYFEKSLRLADSRILRLGHVAGQPEALD